MTPTGEQRELDAWIAEHVMGYRWYLLTEKSGQYCALHQPSHWQERLGAVPVDHPRKDDKREVDVPCYTTDPAAAMEVLRRCLKHYGKRGGSIRIHFNGQSGFGLSDNDNRHFTFAAPIELAICQFARRLFENKTAATHTG